MWMSTVFANATQTGNREMIGAAAIRAGLTVMGGPLNSQSDVEPGMARQSGGARTGGLFLLFLQRGAAVPGAGIGARNRHWNARAAEYRHRPVPYKANPMPHGGAIVIVAVKRSTTW